MMTISRRLALLSMVICGWTASAAWCQAPPAWTLKAYLSTGQEIEGTIYRSGDRDITVRTGRRRGSVPVANLVTWSIEPPADADAPWAKLTGAERDVAVGGGALKKRWPAVAELHFRRAMEADGAVKEKVAQAYTDARQKPPAGLLDGEAPQPSYPKATVEQIRANVAKSAELGEKMKEIAPKTHLVETEHFWIYSEWPKSDDRALAAVYEKLYKALCKQFDIPADENIWVGKLPVFAFWEKAHYDTFSVSVIKHERGTMAAGYAGHRGPFSFVVLGPVKGGRSKSRAINWFFELLCHESTHAFVSRYQTMRSIPNWLNEGIAETMSSSLLKKTAAEYRLKMAHKMIKAKQVPDVAQIFTAEHIPLEGPYYGAAQSVVRYLIATDRKKFIALVQAIKNGTAAEQALQDNYGMDYAQLYRNWTRKIR